MTFPNLHITDEQQERMQACWEAFDGIPTAAVKKIKVKDLIETIKTVRETLGCTKTHMEGAHGK